MKQMKGMLSISSFLFVVFICASTGAPQTVPKTLTVPNITAMSGAGAPWGICADRGLRIAVDEINERGGLKVVKDRYLLKVVTYDHRYVAGEALTAARKIVSEGIKYAFGTGVSVMPAMQPVLEENKVIYLGMFGGGGEYTNAKFPYTFRTMPSNEIFYSAFLPKLVKMFGPLKYATVHNNDEAGHSAQRVQDKIVEQLNLPIESYYEFVDREAIDFTAVITRLMAKKIDFISNESQTAQAVSFLKQAHELGYKGKIGILGTGHSMETLVKTAGKEAMEGFFSGSNWPPGQYPSEKYPKVLEKYRSLYKEEPSSPPNVLWNYAATEFLATGIEKAGTLDAERVVKILYDLETPTALGPTSMVGKSLGYGIKTQMAYIIPLTQVKNGRLEMIEAIKVRD